MSVDRFRGALALFFIGSVRFRIDDEGIGLLNRLKKYKLRDIEMYEGGVAFSVNLVHKSAIKRFLGRKPYTHVDNGNAVAVMNFFYARAVLVIAVCCSVVAFGITEQFAFRVNLEGVSGKERTQVLAYMQERGLCGITSKSMARDKGLAVEIVKRFDFLADAHISLRASTITVAVHRAENIAGKIANADIVATHDGVVADIIVFSGTANVSNGDVVRVGDVLVTGTRPTAIITITNGTEVVCVINNVVIK